MAGGSGERAYCCAGNLLHYSFICVEEFNFLDGLRYRVA